MTNSEKYLNVSVNEFFKAIIESKIDISGLYSLENWLLEEAKPTLTEDERVILRNIDKKYTHIGRRDGTPSLELYIKSKKDDFKHCWCFYNHLFQFIKEGEEYNIKELLKDE